MKDNLNCFYFRCRYIEVCILMNVAVLYVNTEVRIIDEIVASDA